MVYGLKYAYGIGFGGFCWLRETRFELWWKGGQRFSKSLMCNRYYFWISLYGDNITGSLELYHGELSRGMYEAWGNCAGDIYEVKHRSLCIWAVSWNFQEIEQVFKPWHQDHEICRSSMVITKHFDKWWNIIKHIPLDL